MSAYHLTLVVGFDTREELLQSTRALHEVARLRGGRVMKEAMESHYPVVVDAALIGGKHGTADEQSTDGPDPVASDAQGEAKTVRRAAKPRANRGAPGATAAAPDVASQPADAPVEPEISYGGDQSASSADVSSVTELRGGGAVPSATWPEVVSVLNQLHAKSFESAKAVLTQCGVARAADLKAEDQAAKRGEVLAAAKKALA